MYTITSVQDSIESPSHRNQTRKINKKASGSEEVKLSLFTDDKILYIEKQRLHQKNY